MPSVFVSYSHENTEEFNELNRFLKPLGRVGIVKAWTDREIKPGDDWREQIDQALGDATVAILLVTQDFLSSDFIANRELPYLLDKHAQKRVTLLPVFLSPTNAATVAPELEGIQGFGTPTKPLSTLPKSDRDTAYARLSTRLVELMGASAKPAEPKPGSSRPQNPRASPSKSYELIIRLERVGASLSTHYQFPGKDPFLSTTRSRDEIAKPVDRILGNLDSGDLAQAAGLVTMASQYAGPDLFNVLFGSNEAHHEHIFREAFHRPHPAPAPTPLLGHIRVRIATHIPEFLGLPWRLTSWKNTFLTGHDWIFVAGSEDDPDNDCITNAPSYVLLVGGAEPTRDPHHLDSVEQTIKAIWPVTSAGSSLVRRADSIAKLENALTGQRPHLVYVCAPIVMHQGEACLCLANDERLPLKRFARHLHETRHQPRVVYLNTIGAPHIDPASTFDRAAELVIWRRLPSYQPDSTTLPIDWMGVWLREGLDPVDALHKVSVQLTKASPEASTLAVYANYRDWRTDRMSSTARDRLSHLRLDREKLKGVVAKWVDELANSDTGRVMALVPFGARGNRLDMLHDQLLHHLDLALDHRVAIKLIRLRFPESRLALHDHLDAELASQLGRDEGEPIAHLLRRHAPKAVGTLRAVLWLDWGVFGHDTAQQPALKPSELGAWLDFTGMVMPKHCPDDLRVVCSLAIESEIQAHDKLTSFLQDKHPQLKDPHYLLKIADPVGHVARNELLDFLKDPRTGCRAHIQSDLSALLHADAQGDFDKLVQRIEEAERTSFEALMNRLRGKGLDAAPRDDTAF